MSYQLVRLIVGRPVRLEPEAQMSATDLAADIREAIGREGEA